MKRKRKVIMLLAAMTLIGTLFLAVTISVAYAADSPTGITPPEADLRFGVTDANGDPVEASLETSGVKLDEAGIYSLLPEKLLCNEVDVVWMQDVQIPEGTLFPVSLSIWPEGLTDSSHTAVFHFDERSGWEYITDCYGTEIEVKLGSLSPVAVVELTPTSPADPSNINRHIKAATRAGGGLMLRSSHTGSSNGYISSSYTYSTVGIGSAGNTTLINTTFNADNDETYSVEMMCVNPGKKSMKDVSGVDPSDYTVYEADWEFTCYAYTLRNASYYYQHFVLSSLIYPDAYWGGANGLWGNGQNAEIESYRDSLSLDYPPDDYKVFLAYYNGSASVQSPYMFEVYGYEDDVRYDISLVVNKSSNPAGYSTAGAKYFVWNKTCTSTASGAIQLPDGRWVCWLIFIPI